MNNLPITLLKILSLTCIAVFLVACGGGGPQRPAPGTPAFNWLNAQDAYKAGDYVRANSLLEQLAGKDHEYTDRARAWAAVMSLGFTRTYMELADKLDDGAKRNNANPAPFRRLANDYRSKAKASAMEFTEVAHRLTAGKIGSEIPLVFVPPEASFEDPRQYKKFAIGQLVPEAELDSIEKNVLKREILRNACEALNAPKESEKVKALYQNGEAKAPAQPFILMVARGLYDIGDMFGPKKLDQPQRVKLVYDEALEALALVKDAKEAQDLSKKIAQSRKKLNI